MQRHPFPFPFGFDLYLFLLRLSHDKQPFTKQAIPSIQQKQLGNTGRQTILIQTKRFLPRFPACPRKQFTPRMQQQIQRIGRIGYMIRLCHLYSDLIRYFFHLQNIVFLLQKYRFLLCNRACFCQHLNRLPEQVLFIPRIPHIIRVPLHPITTRLQRFRKQQITMEQM